MNSIKIASLNLLRTNAQLAIANDKSAKTAMIIAVDNKEIVFKPLQAFATRVVNALRACGASDLTIKDAKSINYKIQGTRVKAIDEAESEEEKAKHISISRQSIDSMIEHFSKLIDLLSAEPLYQPNESDLSIVGLNNLLNTMKAVNTAVINATTDFLNAIIARNELLYQKQTGLVSIANAVKAYVKSVFGSKSAEFKEVSRIKFTQRKLH